MESVIALLKEAVSLKSGDLYVLRSILSELSLNDSQELLIKTYSVYPRDVQRALDSLWCRTALSLLNNGEYPNEPFKFIDVAPAKLHGCYELASNLFRLYGELREGRSISMGLIKPLPLFTLRHMAFDKLKENHMTLLEGIAKENPNNIELLEKITKTLSDECKIELDVPELCKSHVFKRRCAIIERVTRLCVDAQFNAVGF